MKPTVYIETSIVSYLTAWQSRDVIRQAHQELTRRWWRDRRSGFSLLTSQAVIEEAAAGDPKAAEDRLDILARIPLLQITPSVELLVRRLLDRGALPRKARVDAFHLATATSHGVEYLLTWNCKHLANATLRGRIEETCLDAGFQPPVICTPFELDKA